MASRLTKAEREWLYDLQAVLDRCPSKRFGAYGGGDTFIYLYDKNKYEKFCKKNEREIRNGDLEEPEIHNKNDDVFCSIQFSFNIDAVRW